MRLVLFLALASLYALAYTQNIQINPSTRHYVDAQGRTRVFHGVNAVYKIPPWVPSNGAFDSQNSIGPQDVVQLQQWGFTAVRLGTMWPGVMPARGVVNTTYLQQVESIVNALGAAGIYSIIDMHQDLLSRFYCGEGMPDWLVSHDSLFKFPIPISNPNITYDPNTGYPNLQDCLEVQFAAYYMSDAVSVLFQELYTNSHNMTDYLKEFWGAVSTFFASNPYVLGYELINEPWAGDYLSNPNLLKPGETDKRYLVPLYESLHNTIRQADNSHILFFEPMVFDEGPSGFKQGPGGPTYNDRQALSYHVYCGFNIDSGGRSLGECNATDALIGGLRLNDMKRIGIGGFMTEFGALNGTQYDVDSLHFITDAADNALQSWTYWQYKFFQDLTTSDSAESFYFNDGTLDTAKVKALSRTYAPAIAGTPVTAKFNALNGEFTLIYDVSLAVNASTVIYLNEQLYYPNGYSLIITPAGVASYTQTSANWLSVTPLTKTDGTRITVQVAPK